MRYVAERLEDVIAGFVTGGIGLFIIIEASGYQLGTLRSMGPGYFPTILGSIMVALGAMMIVTAQPGRVELTAERGQLRGMIFVAAAFSAFALTIESLGTIVAVSLAVFLSALGNRRTPLLVALVLAVATAVVSVLIFRVGLGLQFKAF